MIYFLSSRQILFAVTSLLFAASTIVTIIWCASMSSMKGMPMPGGWNMSMAWMRMPGQSWSGAAVSFLGMWGVMMIAMMLPSLVAMLLDYRKVVSSKDKEHLGRLTTLVGIGYFIVWTFFGVAVFPLGVTLAAIVMQHPALAHGVPVGIGVVVLIAGCIQFTSWKLHSLNCCRRMPDLHQTLPANDHTAWQYGLRLGIHCGRCCANLMIILLLIRVMNLGAMAIITIAITFERLLPSRERAARIIGAITILVGLFIISKATGPF